MKLFQPRPPKVADASQVAAALARTMSAPPAPSSPVELGGALSRIKQEIASLRAIVEAAKGLRSTPALQKSVAQSNEDGRTKYRELERLQRQFHAGLIEMPALDAVFKEYNRIVARTQALQTDLQTRNAADSAQAEINRILQEVA